MINVGIIGCGFVGGALKDWLEHNNPECKLFISDPAKGYNDDLSNIEIAFLQIHVRTEDDGTQDLTLMKELISNLPDVPVFVRTHYSSWHKRAAHQRDRPSRTLHARVPHRAYSHRGLQEADHGLYRSPRTPH